MANYRNTLEVGFDGKGIPYGGFGEVRPDGGANDDRLFRRVVCPGLAAILPSPRFRGRCPYSKGYRPSPIMGPS